jgi:LysM repeat protein
MSHNIFSERINLQLFAEGGDVGSGTGADGANGVTAGVPSLPTKGAKNPLADVKYGIQEDAQTANVQSKSEDNGTVATEDRNAKFEALIKGEFKDLYDARVQDTIQKRLKGTKETVDKYNELTPTLEMLARKYGVDVSDIKALNKAIEDDDAYYEEEAMEKGISVEQLKNVRKMERENAELRKQMEEQNNRERAERDVAEWMKQAEAAKHSFPNLDLGEELKNPQFINLLQSGVGVETAYFAMHHRELVPQAMQYTAKAVEQKLTNKVIANGARPTENGIKSQSSVIVKSDVSQLSKADRAEIIRRVARGEKIKF